MLAVKKEHRGKGIATKLVRMAINMMIERDADEVHHAASCRWIETDLCGRLLSKLMSPIPQR